MAVEHFALAQPLGPRGDDILLADLVEKRVFGEQCRGGKSAERHGEQRQRQMPEIVANLGRPRQAIEIVREQTPEREHIEIAAPGKHHDQHDGKQKAGHRIADNNHRAGPHIEPGSVAHRLGNAQGYGNSIGQQCHPQAQRDRHRHFFDHQVDHRDIAKIALAKVKADVVAQHEEEALERRLVEAELLLQLLDEFRVQPLRAAIFAARAFTAGLGGIAGAEVAAGFARNARGGRNISAGKLGNHLFHRPARGELNHQKTHRHDAKQGWHDKQQTTNEIGDHGLARVLI